MSKYQNALVMSLLLLEFTQPCMHASHAYAFALLQTFYILKASVAAVKYDDRLGLVWPTSRQKV
jgi:hypothetical protein